MSCSIWLSLRSRGTQEPCRLIVVNTNSVLSPLIYQARREPRLLAELEGAYTLPSNAALDRDMGRFRRSHRGAESCTARLLKGPVSSSRRDALAHRQGVSLFTGTDVGTDRGSALPPVAFDVGSIFAEVSIDPAEASARSRTDGRWWRGARCPPGRPDCPILVDFTRDAVVIPVKGIDIVGRAASVCFEIRLCFALRNKIAAIQIVRVGGSGRSQGAVEEMLCSTWSNQRRRVLGHCTCWRGCRSSQTARGQN